MTAKGIIEIVKESELWALALRNANFKWGNMRKPKIIIFDDDTMILELHGSMGNSDSRTDPSSQ
jgi:hypothetical protein